MKHFRRFVAVAFVAGLLSLATAAPAFAAHGGANGPPSGATPATGGLGNALTQVVANVPPGSPGELGTDIAAFTVAANNPAVDECALGAC